MESTQKQLQTALRKALKAEGLATQKDLAPFATKEDLKTLATKTDLAGLTKKVEQGQTDILEAINTAFQEHENKVNGKLDSIQTSVDFIRKKVTEWPAPSQVYDLIENRHKKV